jgi:CheY-like chemotaxis protein
VDDEVMNLRVIKSQLKGLDLNVIEAQDGYEALKIFCEKLDDELACKNCYNFRAIISDLNMPIMDGATS